MNMRNIFLALLIIATTFFSNRLFASHMVGGEITWECLPNGQYVFYMEVYRECTGTWFYFGNQNIDYQGGSITLKPDSNRWLSYGGNGNISAIGLNGCQRICSSNNTSSSELGATQFFPYVSDPVSLNGTPPPGGWLFTWTLCCRPSSVANLITPASRSFTLRARMYPYKGKDASQCYDSSPSFAELPAALYCKTNSYLYNPNAVDKDLDSVVYSWAVPWDQVNVQVDFKSGYTFNNPLPDTSFHPLNIPAILDQQTGEISFTTYSGLSGRQYASCIRVDSYRDGLMIASVFREIPFISFDCPSNNSPSASFNGLQTNSYFDTVMAGELVNIPFQISDPDIDSSSMQPQQIAVAPRGFLFSNDFSDSLDCDSIWAPCATVSPVPIFDSITNEFLIKNQGTVNASFRWKTSCAHLGPDTARLANSQVYKFVFKSFDDACDIPATNYPSINIVVKRFKPIIQQNGNVLSVDTAESYQWYYNGNPIPNSDTNSIFVISHGKYTVEVVKNGCLSQQTNYRFLSVSVDEKEWGNQLKIYPNPFKNGFVVDLGGLNTNDISIVMMDMNGKEILVQSKLEKDKILIDHNSHLSPGVYFIKIRTDGDEAYKKLIKL